jgi:hypothetical protein
MKKTKLSLQSSLFLCSLSISVSLVTDLKAQDQVRLNNNSGNPIGLLVDGKLNGSLRAHKLRQIAAMMVKASSITSSDVSTYLRHGWISRRGWTFAETPLNAISPTPTAAQSQPK